MGTEEYRVLLAHSIGPNAIHCIWITYWFLEKTILCAEVKVALEVLGMVCRIYIWLYFMGDWGLDGTWPPWRHSSLLHFWVLFPFFVEKCQCLTFSSCFSLLLRLLQQWHAQAQCSAREQSAIIAMKTQRHRRTLLAAFTSWKERFLYQQSLARAAARHWRQRALESKAASHRVTCLTWYSYTRWRWALHRRRDRY